MSADNSLDEIPALDPSPHLCQGLSITVPVEVDVPPALVAACRQSYENRLAMGGDPEFEDYLWDLITWEPTFVVNGYVVDSETGHGVEEVER